MSNITQRFYYHRPGEYANFCYRRLRQSGTPCHPISCITRLLDLNVDIALSSDIVAGSEPFNSKADLTNSGQVLDTLSSVLE